MSGGRIFRTGLVTLVLTTAVLAVVIGPGVCTLGVPGTIAAQPPASAPAWPFKLEKGDHICIIGNTLADRMQHDGWLETFLHAR